MRADSNGGRSGRTLARHERDVTCNSPDRQRPTGVLGHRSYGAASRWRKSTRRPVTEAPVASVELAWRWESRGGSRWPGSLDTQAGDRPADHKLLDLLGAFEDVVDHSGPSSVCCPVSRSPLTRGFASAQSARSVGIHGVVGMSRDGCRSPTGSHELREQVLIRDATREAHRFTLLRNGTRPPVAPTQVGRGRSTEADPPHGRRTSWRLPRAIRRQRPAHRAAG